MNKKLKRKSSKNRSRSTGGVNISGATRVSVGGDIVGRDKVGPVDPYDNDYGILTPDQQRVVKLAYQQGGVLRTEANKIVDRARNLSKRMDIAETQEDKALINQQEATLNTDVAALRTKILSASMTIR